MSNATTERARGAAILPIRKSIEVARDATTAFRFFTERAGRWWPLETHTISSGKPGAKAVACTFEPRTGGRIYETADDGTEHEWGRILMWEPGKRLVFTWHLSRAPEQATEVAITFTALGANRTRVELEHRNWERWGADGPSRRENYDKGWDLVFNTNYAGYCARTDA